MDNPPVVPSENSRFGAELRRVRAGTGWTQEKLARRIDVQKGQISKLETGRRPPSRLILKKLDSVAALGGGSRWSRLWEDLTGSGRPAWLDEIHQALRDAVRVMDWQTTVWPGLLQTEGYARELITAGSPWAPPSSLEKDVRDRVERADAFSRGDSPLMWVVVDEMIIRRRDMPDDVRSAQIRHVVDLVEAGRISAQVLPMNTVGHPGLSGPFKLITPSAGADVVYAESAHEGQTVDNQTEVGRYRLLFGRLQAMAMSPADSLAAMKAEI